MVTILVLKTFIYTRCRWNYLLLTGRHLCHYLMERIIHGFTTMIDKKNTFPFISLILSSFGVNFVCSTLKIVPSLAKFVTL